MRGSLLSWLERRGGTIDDYAFPSRIDHGGHLSTWQYARLVDEWVAAIGLRRADYGSNERFWLSDSAGTRAIVAGKLTAGSSYPTPSAERVPQMLFDRDGNLWGISTTKGIFLVTRPDPANGGALTSAISLYGAQEGLSSDLTSVMLKDREENIWVGFALGLDRFRATAFAADSMLAIASNGGAALVATEVGPFISATTRASPWHSRAPPPSDCSRAMSLHFAGTSMNRCGRRSIATWCILSTAVPSAVRCRR